MHLKRTAAAALLAMTLASAAHGQTEQLKLTSAGSTVSGGVYVGPYKGVLGSEPGAPTIDVTCVDYFNDAYLTPDPRGTWEVFETSLADGADLSHTRFGSMWGSETALLKYRQAAYLSWQFANAPSSEWGNIHRTIWNVFTSAAPDPSSSFWLNQAAYWYANYGATYDWSTVLVLSDAAMSPASTLCPAWATGPSGACAQLGGRQEFITTTPEPATILLMGTGLLALVFITRRRRATA